ncbi:Crp/Fnr family transcriptional regulator [Methylobacterium sp. WL18]|uniref:Crp/Fnr family transcriptional regulator n=1 Tax=Methylobacterium sp. WL18 TaxID=2603897 RepID=UPI0011C916FD|nr:Crp/Fnr family transcriptional regulator [Methylobacterium sp. WL18]TXN76592.1 Crp/Fnr family transcriptional regulator [Methylobacterium sp. WL18]
MSVSVKHPLDVMIRKLGGSGRFSQAEMFALKSLSVVVRTLEAHHDIVPEGGPATHCCIVLSGWTCCYQLLDEGRRQLLSFHLPGDLPDLQGLHLSEIDFGMATLTPAVVAYVPHTDLRRLIESFPGISTALWHEAQVSAAIHRAWMSSLGRRAARERLAHLFCELYLRLKAVGLANGNTLPMPLRQPDLADALGLTSVHVNRTLKDLREDGLISLKARRLEILDWARLQAIGQFSPRYLHG